MVHLLAAAALAAATPAPFPHQPSPAMYVVRDADTTIFLFGSFHALDSNRDWFSNRIRGAFESSDELVLETIVPKDPTIPLIARQTFPARSITTSASFLATTRMAISAGRSQGLQVANGADMVLRNTAEAEGKQVDALETLESQLQMFAQMPPASSRAAPPAGPENGGPPDNLSTTMVAMQAAWKRGDHAVFARMLDQMRRNAPVTYKLMFVDRNARWADWIAGRLQSPGIVFVAVGAGHLAGRDSVLVRLAEQGVESTRLN